MKQLVISFFVLTNLSACALAQAFVYHPNNPNFGGNTFNYSWMLSQAQAQDRNVDPATKRTTTSSGGNSTLNNFSQSLQNQLLSRITSSLINKQFGETTLQPGTYKFGEFQVDISNSAEGVIIRIVDGKGGETSVTIPYF